MNVDLRVNFYYLKAQNANGLRKKKRINRFFFVIIFIMFLHCRSTSFVWIGIHTDAINTVAN